MTIVDGIEFVHDHLLSKLQTKQLEMDIVLHPVCSAVKLELTEKLAAVSGACAHSATVPVQLGCCGFAGDRGLLYPELTGAATKAEAEAVCTESYDGYYSSSRTCELGMTLATGKTYQSFLYLVEKATRDHL